MLLPLRLPRRLLFFELVVRGVAALARRTVAALAVAILHCLLSAIEFLFLEAAAATEQQDARSCDEGGLEERGLALALRSAQSDTIC